MDPKLHRYGLGVALLLLVAVDLALDRLDVFGPFLPATRPQTLFDSVNSQLVDLVRTLRGVGAGAKPIAFVGNSQMDMGTKPLSATRDALVRAGAPPDTRVVSLSVLATTLSDAETTSRHLGSLAPDLVVLGISAPDVGTEVERARLTPVTQMLDTGLGDGLVPPADLEARLDRWVRSVWRLYRYRRLLADLATPARGASVPRDFYDEPHAEPEFFATLYGEDHAPRLLELRDKYKSGASYADVERYVGELQGDTYLAGLRERWRALEPNPIQLEALRRFAANVRAAGGRPVWVLLPENPAFEADPEVGAQIAARSERAARAVQGEADVLGVPLIDLRHAVPREGFLDLNHLFLDHAGFAPILARELAARGLLSPPAGAGKTAAAS
jgi:hypothetical protein